MKESEDKNLMAQEILTAVVQKVHEARILFIKARRDKLIDYVDVDTVKMQDIVVSLDTMYQDLWNELHNLQRKYVEQHPEIYDSCDDDGWDD